jgi:hypothetical protein
MTEVEWMECTDPEPMLNFLHDRTSCRKLLLFACACSRFAWDLLSADNQCLVAAVEKAVDDPVKLESLRGEVQQETQRRWQTIVAEEYDRSREPVPDCPPPTYWGEVDWVRLWNRRSDWGAFWLPTILLLPHPVRAATKIARLMRDLRGDAIAIREIQRPSRGKYPTLAAWQVAWDQFWERFDEATEEQASARESDAARQMALQVTAIRDIFGNPFGASTVVPSVLSWRDGTFQQMVSSIY